MSSKRFKLVFNPKSTLGAVLYDGKPVPGVLSAELRLEAGKLPQVNLLIHAADVDIEIEPQVKP